MTAIGLNIYAITMPKITGLRKPKKEFIPSNIEEKLDNIIYKTTAEHVAIV